MKSINDNGYQTPYTVSLDTDQPLSFITWKKTQARSVLYEQEYNLYNEYLINWYQNKKNIQVDSLADLRLSYLILLKQIQIFFSREEVENWYAGVDLNNEKELLLAIPYFSTKLKEIGLYYQHLREDIKKTKIKYNLVGTEKSTVQRLQELILSNYTKKESYGSITIPNTVWKNIPELSAVTDTLNIEFEDYYDNRTYYDRSPTLPISAYFNFNNELTEKYFSQKGLSLNDIDWIYRLGQFSLSSLFTNELSTTAFNLSSLIFEISEQFLGSSRYSTFLVQASAKKDFFTLNIAQGNNFFFWPQGIYKTAVKGATRYQAVDINESGLKEIATAGDTLETADTIFLKSKTGIQGAWLYNKIYDVKDVTMEARIAANDKTIFRYPFPGFGLSSEDIPWTGYSLVSDPRYFYLSDSVKKDIENVYWNTALNLSSTTPVNINDTTLVNAGAYPSKNYDLADKIKIYIKPPSYTSSTTSNLPNEVWLYRFEKTDIPIAPGGTEGNSVIHWPLKRINPSRETVVNSLPNNFCAPIKLNDIDYTFSTASNALSTADVIYKIKNFKDTILDAQECAWLSGSEFYYKNSQTRGINQASFCSIFLPGSFTRFVWASTNQININRVFKGTETHLPDCKFINTPGATYNNFDLCTCKQVYFSPFGHPGNTFDEYPGLADFIIEDTSFNEEFDINSWRDVNGTSFFESSAACWFQTNNSIGWGNGRWVANSSVFANNFYLQQGKRYIYYRAGIKDIDKNIKELPEYVVRYKYPVEEISKPVWIRAKKDPQTRLWVSTNTKSDMTFYPGDFLIYQRTPTIQFEVTGTQIRQTEIQTNPITTNDTNIERGSVWSNYTYITINNNLQPIIVSYPVETLNFPVTQFSTDYRKQIPLPFSQIRRLIAWKLTAPDNTSFTYLDASSFSFVPTVTGVYSVTLTAITGTSFEDEGFYYFTNIPRITAISPTTVETTLSTSLIPVPGFVLSTPLKGWDYSNNTFGRGELVTALENTGAVPYWAITYTEKTSLTDYKGVNSWGSPVRVFDNYNLITQPEYSTFALSGGEYFEYTRNFPSNIIWRQPLQLLNRVNQKVWCNLNYETKSPQNNQINLPDLITYPTTTPSTLQLQNYIENEPVEVHYNAVNSFTWNVTATPEIQETIYTPPVTSTFLTNKEPWANLFNRNNPTVAFFPSFDCLSSVKEIGDYFTPKNLGTLTYINKDYTPVSTLSTVNTLEIFANPSQNYNIRGFSKQSPTNLFDISQENNIWLKEPPSSGAQAGTIKNTIFKKYPKFIPYQSTTEVIYNNKTGLITPTSRQTPWGGKNNLEWADRENIPIDFKGEINVNSWSDDQILKVNGLYLDNWATDIYGNQYGLYKNLQNLPVRSRIEMGGEIWTRKNSQTVEPGTASLSSIYNQYKNINLYNELTSNRIFKIDTFFDTLYIETSTAVLFEKIDYDYITNQITSKVDSSRQISLRVPTTNNLNREFNSPQITFSNYSKPGNTWFLPKEKVVFIPVVEITNNKAILPKLYKHNLTKENLELVFPINQEDLNDIYQLAGLNASSIQRPVISYNSLKKIFLYSFIVENPTSKHIVEIELTNLLTTNLKNIRVYSQQTAEVLPPEIIDTDLTATVTMEQFFTRGIKTNSTDVFFEPINMPRWATITSSGLFVCQPRTVRGALRQPYYLQFKASNAAGPAFYTILINVI